MISLNPNLKNRKLFKKIENFNKRNFKKKNLSKGVILCEFTTNKSVQACFSIFTNFIQKQNKSKIVAYNSEIQKNKISNIIRKIKSNFFSNYNYELYKSFNVSDFIFIENHKEIKKKCNNKSKKLLLKIKKKI